MKTTKLLSLFLAIFFAQIAFAQTSETTGNPVVVSEDSIRLAELKEQARQRAIEKAIRDSINKVIADSIRLVREDSIQQARQDSIIRVEKNKQADSIFKSANNKLKVKWAALDSMHFVARIEEYALAVELNPDFWQAYRNRARIFIFQKRYREALMDLTEALNHADNNHSLELHEMRGIVNYELGHYKEALPDLDFAIQKSHDKGKYMLLRAKTKWKMGLKKEACKDYQEAIEINPGLATQKEFIHCK